MEQIEPKLLFDESVVVHTSIEKQTGITVVVPVKTENSLPPNWGYIYWSNSTDQLTPKGY